MDIRERKLMNFVSLTGDNRSGIERRRFSYDAHIPERRSGLDRRNLGVRPNIPEKSYDEIALALG